MWLYRLSGTSGEPIIAIKYSHIRKGNGVPRLSESGWLTTPCTIWHEFNDGLYQPTSPIKTNAANILSLCWISLVTKLRRSPRTTIYLSSHYYQTRLLKSSAQFLLGFILLLLVRSQSEPAKNLNMDVQPKLKTNPADAVNQKARRRRKSLFKKASQYSSECDADIHLVLRMKKSGKIFVLASKTKDWPLSQHQLVSSLGHRFRRQKGNNLIPRGLIIPHPFKCLQATQSPSRESLPC